MFITLLHDGKEVGKGSLDLKNGRIDTSEKFDSISIQLGDMHLSFKNIQEDKLKESELITVKTLLCGTTDVNTVYFYKDEMEDWDNFCSMLNVDGSPNSIEAIVYSAKGIANSSLLEKTHEPKSGKVIDWSGRLIDPMNLQLSDLENIGLQSAITLSRVCRFWSQTRVFYSVSQHCLSLVRYLEETNASDELIKWALGHEVFEAKTGIDLPSPQKNSPEYRGYKEAEEHCLALFAQKYGLTPPMPQAIKDLDKGIMVMEANALMPYNPDVNWEEITGYEPVGRLYKLGASEEEIKNDFILAWQKYFGSL